MERAFHPVLNSNVVGKAQKNQVPRKRQNFSMLVTVSGARQLQAMLIITLAIYGSLPS